MGGRFLDRVKAMPLRGLFFVTGLIEDSRPEAQEYAGYLSATA